MRTLSGIIIGVAVIVVLAFMTGVIYIVDETQQVVITQFGKPVGKPVTTAGLHLSLPVAAVRQPGEALQTK